MRTIKRANIVYFTGTGSTELVAKEIKAELIKRGIDYTIKSISVNDTVQLMPAEVLFFLYPVHAGDASEAVYQYIQRLPNMAIPMTDCAILSISAGGEGILNTASRSKVIRKLLKKGYKTVYEDMIVMPNNFVTAFSDELIGMLMYALPIKIKYMLDRISNEEICRRSARPIDSVLRTICEPFKLFARVNGRLLKANSNCSGCGICESICPTGNIKMKKDKPDFGWDCVMCTRCMYKCPEDAIGNTVFNAIKVKGGYDIDRMEKLSDNITSFTEKDILELTKDKSDSQIRKYLLEVLNIVKADTL